MSDTPKSLFTFDVVTIKSAGKLEAISEIHPLTVKDRIRLLRMDGNAELNSLMDEYTSRLAGENVEKFYRILLLYLL